MAVTRPIVPHGQDRPSKARTPEEVQERPARRFGSLVPLSARHAYAWRAVARSSFGDNGGGDDGAPQR